MGRAPCCDKANVKKGPWSPEEDAKLKAYIEQHGTGGNWIALPQKIGLKRCGKSCRLRWLNYLRPNIKHGGFSEEEDNIICSLYVSIGSRWSIIAAQLPGRTDNDIKNYWNTRLKKKLLGKQRNNKDYLQARRLTTLKHQHQHQQDQIMKQREHHHHHHHHLVSSSSGVLITNNQTTTTPTPPNYWPAVEHCVAAPIMPLINIPNNNNINNNASTTINIIQQDHYDLSSLSSSLMKELDGIKFSHDQQPQPYISINSHESQVVYNPTTMMLTSSDDANIFQGYENLFPTSGGDDDDLSHLVSVNPPQEIIQGGLYGMESMEMAISGSTNTTSTTDQSTSYSWGDMSSLVINNYSPNLVPTDHHCNEDNAGCPQPGIPPQDAAFQDSNRYFGIQMQ